MTIGHVETPSAMVPGLKSMGEGGVIGAAGCIVNAVSDACGGVPSGTHPLTPERVLRHLAAGRARSR